MPLINVTDEELITLRAALNHAEQTYGDPVNSVRIASALAALSREHAQPAQYTPLADGTYHTDGPEIIRVEESGFTLFHDTGQAKVLLQQGMAVCRLTPPAQEGAGALGLVVNEYLLRSNDYMEDVVLRRQPQDDDSIKWAINSGGNALNKQYVWEYEPSPSSRDNKYLERCRYDSVEEALQHWQEWLERQRPSAAQATQGQGE